MKRFETLADIHPYYNSESDTYDFSDNGTLLDIELTFSLCTHSNIRAHDIRVSDRESMLAYNINAHDITGGYILSGANIYANDITDVVILLGDEIHTHDIDVLKINGGYIYANIVEAADIVMAHLEAADTHCGVICHSDPTCD